ncbi:hypothetical protein Tco_0950404 [Tanacetum coccineum]
MLILSSSQPYLIGIGMKLFFLQSVLIFCLKDEVIVIPSDDDESGANEPIPALVEDADVKIAPHPNPFFNPHLMNWNWDDVIVIPSDDEEPDANEELFTPVNVLGRKRVYALIDESDSDDEPYRSKAFLF